MISRSRLVLTSTAVSALPSSSSLLVNSRLQCRSSHFAPPRGSPHRFFSGSPSPPGVFNPFSTEAEAQVSPWIEYWSEFTHVKLMKNVLVNIHEFSGAPWWLTIVSLSFGVRLMLSPINHIIWKRQIRMGLLMPSFQHLVRSLSCISLDSHCLSRI